MSPDALARRQFILRGAFALIIGLFLASNVVALVETAGVRTRNHALIDRMLASLEQISPLAHDDGERAIAEARERQQRATILLGAITVGGTAIALCFAMWVSRVLRRRDELVREATARLELQNHELDAFAGRVAHDLRGPLSTISLSATTLADAMPEGDRAIAILHRGIARMEALISDLLELSHLDGPQGHVGHVAVVAKRLQEDLDPVVTGANGALHVDIEPADVTCSDGLLRQALWNLGENAVKYRRTEAAFDLAIRGRSDGQSYELRVADNGAGMSTSEISHAFDPFFRGDHVRAIPGNGLGLSIVKRIIEAAGGTIGIESAPSCGTTFVIHLPLAQRTR